MSTEFVNVNLESSEPRSQTLSVCMMMQNSEQTIAMALESLEYVYDELIIVDGGSEDSSNEIAASYGAKIIHSPWKCNHSKQRNVYLKEIKTDWVFVIDSDEFIDKNTLSFLKELKRSGGTLATDNFWIARKWISPFSKDYFVSSPPHYPDWQRRIFRYNESITYSGQIHESIHGLTQTGEALVDICVYHSDLLIKSQSQRQEKVQKYMKSNPQDGMPHYYLPNLEQLTLQKWDHKSLLPEVQYQLNATPMKCKVCESDSHYFGQGKILSKYDVEYYKCSSCGFVQTEEPYWLDEAYSQPIASSDVGYAYRNMSFSQVVKLLLFNFFNHQEKFLDYGAGYGLFVRLMRDAGFDFYWFDKFCQNIFAQGFEISTGENHQFDLVTAFEVFEHLVHPINELEELLKFSRNILFSTELLPENNPKPEEWWYYATHEGQHISLYSIKSLQALAAKFGLNLYSNGASLHLLTEKEMPENLFQRLMSGSLAAPNKVSLLQNDFLKAVSRVTSSQQNIEILTSNKKVETEDNSQNNLNILIDGVFFQLYRTGIARVWTSLLEQWSKTNFARHILVLDRANTAPKIPGIRYRTIPAYSYDKTGADRAMLQKICDEESAAVFISTYYTTPETTPSVFMAYDMIPEVLKFNLQDQMWQEKHHAIRHASAYISISESTARDLNKFFPEIPAESVRVAHCGVSEQLNTATQEQILNFKTKYGLHKPYFLLVGSGFTLPTSYKNGSLFFKAFSQLINHNTFDIICTGASALDPNLRQYTSGSVVHLLTFTDAELRLAYAGATALIFPSLYEGFGMPIVEAMACGCPVITCSNSSIPEAAGEAALYVNETDVTQMADALCEVQKPSVRERLIHAGLQQAQKFTWNNMAEKVATALLEATIPPLNLRDTNYIVFPDWSQPEESIASDLEEALAHIATTSDPTQTTLIVYIEDQEEEIAQLILNSAAMSLLMSTDLDISEGLEISLLGQLSDLQWKALSSRLSECLQLRHNNPQAISIGWLPDPSSIES
jgi:glycosyltransferase involved in cell wall biosynthesis